MWGGGGGGPPALLPRVFVAGRGRPPPLPTSQPGSLEHFLTERYRLFTLGRKGRGVRVGEIAHGPWRLQEAECDLSACEMTQGLGFDLPNRDPVLHYADKLDVVAWLPTRA
ncbi:MAG: DUF2071 domain-containing protein [Planctomycetota bacterium]